MCLFTGKRINSCFGSGCPQGSLRTVLAFCSCLGEGGVERLWFPFSVSPSASVLAGPLYPSLFFQMCFPERLQFLAWHCIGSINGCYPKFSLVKPGWLMNRQIASSLVVVINQGTRLTFPSVANPQTSKVWQQNGRGVLVCLGFPSSTLLPGNTHLRVSPGGNWHVGFSDGFRCWRLVAC